MCGIVGVAAFDQSVRPTEAMIRAMCATIVHRGPDGEGIEVKDGVGLGMRRLAVIDVAGGDQPIFNEDKTVRTVFNGEIYNFRELREALIQKGHRFATHSDTEVIVHAYEEHGEDFPAVLNGMFAFALHDRRKKRLYLVRDHVGVKPLYFAFDGRCLVWASEIKAILASGLVRPELNFDALSEFLTWEYVPGEQTLFGGIRQVAPGQMITVDLERAEMAPSFYWDVAPEGEQAYSDREWEEALDEKLKACVRRQLVSDVPLGAFLSGGVDSSLLVSAMGPTETFSIGFAEQSYNELGYSRKVADHLGLNHITEIIKPDVSVLFETLMHSMDDPIGDFSIFPTYLVSQLARKRVTVSLSGDGGDELFGGYETYLANRYAHVYRRIPRVLRGGFIRPLIDRMKPTDKKKGIVNKLKRFVEWADLPEGLQHARWRMFLNEGMMGRLLTQDAHAQIKTPPGRHIAALFERAGARGPLNRCLYVDFKSYLPDNILVKVDRMSMAVSLESRVPYLDPELVDLAFQVPDRLKIEGRETKSILKRLAARYVPRECVYRPKEGFSIPMKHWLNTKFKPIVEDYLDETRLRKQGIFDIETLKTLRRQHAAGDANHSHVLWAVIVFQAWHRRWLEAN